MGAAARGALDEHRNDVAAYLSFSSFVRRCLSFAIPFVILFRYILFRGEISERARAVKSRWPKSLASLAPADAAATPRKTHYNNPTAASNFVHVSLTFDEWNSTPPPIKFSEASLGLGQLPAVDFPEGINDVTTINHFLSTIPAANKERLINSTGH
jgi:hypothetical protein